MTGKRRAPEPTIADVFRGEHRPRYWQSYVLVFSVFVLLGSVVYFLNWWLF